MSAEGIRREVKAMTEAAARLDLHPGEPLARLLAGMGALAGEQAATTAELLALAAELRERRAIDPEVLDKVCKAAVSGANRNAAALARAHNWRTLVIAAAVFVLAVCVAGWNGYRTGRADALAGVRQTEAGLREMFRDGPDAARDWLNLATGHRRGAHAPRFMGPGAPCRRPRRRRCAWNHERGGGPRVAGRRSRPRGVWRGVARRAREASGARCPRSAARRRLNRSGFAGGSNS